MINDIRSDAWVLQVCNVSGRNGVNSFFKRSGAVDIVSVLFGGLGYASKLGSLLQNSI